MLFTAGAAVAAPFGSYTSGLTFGSQPTYSFGGSAGTISLSGSTQLTAQTGAFDGVSAGSAGGTFGFSLTPTETVATAPTTVLSFVDPAGGSSAPITFTVLSVETVNYSISQADGDTIQLYILGNTAGGASGAEGSLSSLVLNLYGVSGMAVTSSATLSNLPVADPNPPSPSPSPNPSPTPAPVPIPEPGTVALLGAGLAGMALLRQRAWRRQELVARSSRSTVVTRAR